MTHSWDPELRFTLRRLLLALTLLAAPALGFAQDLAIVGARVLADAVVC